MPHFLSTLKSLGVRGLIQLASAALTRFTEKPIAMAQLVFDRPIFLPLAGTFRHGKQVGQERKLGFCVVVADGQNDDLLLGAVESCMPSGAVFSQTLVLDLVGGVGKSSSLSAALEGQGVEVASVEKFLASINSSETEIVYFLKSSARWEMALLSSWLKPQTEGSIADIFWGDVRVIPAEGLSSVKSFPIVNGEFPIFRLPEVPYFGVKREHLIFAQANPGALRLWSQLIEGVNISISKQDSLSVTKASPILVSEREQQRTSLNPEVHVDTTSAETTQGMARPLISVIVPTRDKRELLESCLDSVRRNSEGWRLELIVLDNGSKEPETLDYLDTLSRGVAVVLREPGEFNFAKLINLGVQVSSGSICVILNNDIVVNDPSWLSKAVSVASRKGVGAVGFKLLYADGRVQHSGVTIGYRGSAGHFFRGQDNNADKSPSLDGVWPVEAVTGACLVVEVAKFRLAQGMDEKLAVGLNDVDFCLRLGRLGLTNYVLCDSEIFHVESASRGTGFTYETLPRALEEIVHFRRTWGIGERRDKFFNKRFWLGS
jgi:GT2 family glycosyltransferase